MNKANKWGVVVGQPKRKAWKKLSDKPDLTNVGRWVLGDVGSRHATFPTRALARAFAKQTSKFNLWWHFVAKKYDG